jgi:hypothetical protein
MRKKNAGRAQMGLGSLQDLTDYGWDGGEIVIVSGLAGVTGLLPGSSQDLVPSGLLVAYVLSPQMSSRDRQLLTDSLLH